MLMEIQMEGSRGNSPIHPSPELYDHRNQPDSLPVRLSFSDSTGGPFLRPAIGFADLPVFDADDVDDDGESGDLDEECYPTARVRTSSMTSSIVHPHKSSSAIRSEISPVTIPPSSSSGKHHHRLHPRSATGGTVSYSADTVDGGRDGRPVINPFVASASMPSSASPTRPGMVLPSPSQPPSQQRTKSRRMSFDPHRDRERRPTGNTVDTVISMGSAGSNTNAMNTPNTNNKDRDSGDESPEETGSRVNSEDEVEEDVCLPPMNYEHKRVNGIDFDEIDEFVAMQRLEKWYPSLSRRADDDMPPRLVGTAPRVNESSSSTNSPSSDYENSEKILVGNGAGAPAGIVFDEKTQYGVQSRLRSETVSSVNKEKLEMLKVAAQKVPPFSRPSMSKPSGSGPGQAAYMPSDRFSFSRLNTKKRSMRLSSPC